MLHGPIEFKSVNFREDYHTRSAKTSHHKILHCSLQSILCCTDLLNSERETEIYPGRIRSWVLKYGQIAR